MGTKRSHRGTRHQNQGQATSRDTPCPKRALPSQAPASRAPAPRASMATAASHTQTRTWASESYSEQERAKRELALLETRMTRLRNKINQTESNMRRMFPRSPVVQPDMDRNAHRVLFQRDQDEIDAHVAARQRRIAQERAEQGLPAQPPRISTPFGNRHLEYDDNLSTVLSQPTIFTPNYALGRMYEVADYPESHEQKYEGDERISTDIIHGRFPPHPRVAGNNTVNWQHRSMIPQYPLENFHYPIPDENEIFLRFSFIPELEFSDQEGAWAIGEDLMNMLDE